MTPRTYTVPWILVLVFGFCLSAQIPTSQEDLDHTPEGIVVREATRLEIAWSKAPFNDKLGIEYRKYVAEDGPRYKIVAARIRRYKDSGAYMVVNKEPVVKVRSITTQSDGTVRVITQETMDVVRSDGAGRFAQTDGEHTYTLKKYGAMFKVFEEIIQ